MSWLKIIASRSVWCSSSLNRFHCVTRYIHLSRTRQSGHLYEFCTNKRRNAYHTCQRQYILKTDLPCPYFVNNFSSSRKPLLFSDELLQKYLKQMVDEWNQLQKQLTNNQSNSGPLSVQVSSKRLHFLEPLVSKIMLHQQHLADIAELRDIISGVCTFVFQFLKTYFVSGSF